jgi:hypothetical protein
MASDENEQTDDGFSLRKLGIPVAVTVVGAAIGVAMANRPKKPLRETISDLKDVDVGGLAGDLRGKLDSVRGQQEGPGGDLRGKLDSVRGQRDGPGGDDRRRGSDELQKRLQERAKRRAERRKPAPTT